MKQLLLWAGLLLLFRCVGAGELLSQPKQVSVCRQPLLFASSNVVRWLCDAHRAQRLLLKCGLGNRPVPYSTVKFTVRGESCQVRRLPNRNRPVWSTDGHLCDGGNRGCSHLRRRAGGLGNPVRVSSG